MPTRRSPRAGTSRRDPTPPPDLPLEEVTLPTEGLSPTERLLLQFMHSAERRHTQMMTEVTRLARPIARDNSLPIVGSDGEQEQEPHQQFNPSVQPRQQRNREPTSRHA